MERVKLACVSETLAASFIKFDFDTLKNIFTFIIYEMCYGEKTPHLILNFVKIGDPGSPLILTYEVF
jgi:hypothetical protein